ncbi:viral A-type inclusion protein [Clostridium botulinum]|uniref:viral A-type inclusion protein n=1 Tax=Clostridium botulinum TaxID=1491 RepID=UPI0013FE5CC7|nr:viral A-type inclusion protein [Clostridium botulinum]MBY6837987.1 FlxA-like family protein [Clostridium botulinum]NFG63788.1 viral A-type inclusion protein [Clostridium botulinum]NFQ24935.1 viral A-type inclusion protein [Clostridium botulinum]
MSLNINSNNINIVRSNNFKRIGEINNNYNNDLKKNNDDKKTSSLNIQKQDNNKNDLIEKLQKQKQALKERKQSLIEMPMDPKEKKYKLEEINENLQDIEAQIQQLNMNEKEKEVQKEQEEMLKKKAKEEELKTNEDEIREDIVISASLNELIKFSHSKDNIHLLKDSKNRQLVEKGYIKHVTDLNGYTNPNNYNDKRISQITKSISYLEHSVSNEINKINNVAKRIQYKTQIATKKLNYNDDKVNQEKQVVSDYKKQGNIKDNLKQNSDKNLKNTQNK